MARASADTNTNAVKMFSENTVAVLLMALGNTSISTSQYDMMSALDGEKTASSFQHQFRSVVKKARELKGRIDDGETFVPVTPGKKRAAAAFDDTQPVTPKRPKTTPKPRLQKKSAKDVSASPNNDVGDNFADDNFADEVAKMVKIEKQEFAFDDEI